MVIRVVGVCDCHANNEQVFPSFVRIGEVEKPRRYFSFLYEEEKHVRTATHLQIKLQTDLDRNLFNSRETILFNPLYPQTIIALATRNAVCAITHRHASRVFASRGGKKIAQRGEKGARSPIPILLKTKYQRRSRRASSFHAPVVAQEERNYRCPFHAYRGRVADLRRISARRLIQLIRSQLRSWPSHSALSRSRARLSLNARLIQSRHFHGSRIIRGE